MDWKNKPKSFWKDKLTPIEYAVTQESGTERAFSGQYWDNKDAGRYECVCCGTPLFESTAKYDSGCGWPSFYQPAKGAAGRGEDIEYIDDNSHGMHRTEVRCKPAVRIWDIFLTMARATKRESAIASTRPPLTLSLIRAHSRRRSEESFVRLPRQHLPFTRGGGHFSGSRQKGRFAKSNRSGFGRHRWLACG